MVMISGFIDEIDANFETQAKVGADIGLKYAEVRSAAGKFVGLHPKTDILEFKKHLDAYGLKVSSLASPIGKVPVSDPFEPEYERFKNFVDVAHMFETTYMRVFSFYLAQDDADLFTSEIAERMSRFAEYAEKAGITLLHENEKGIFGDLSMRCLLLAQKVNSTNFKLIFDFANFVQCKENALDAYNVLKEHVAYFHVKDENASTGESVVAGAGNGCIEEILKTAIAGGYKGFLSLEPHLVNFAGLAALEPDPHKRETNMNGEDAFRKAYSALAEILGRI